MPNKDKTGPEGKGEKTGRGAGDCGTTEKQLDNSRGKGRGPCGDGNPRGGDGKGQGQGEGKCDGTGKGNGKGQGKGARRKGENGITYYT